MENLANPVKDMASRVRVLVVLKQVIRERFELMGTVGRA